MKRADVLAHAEQCVLQDRNKTYGEPEDNFTLIAAKWSITLGVEVTSAQVALCMVDLKTCRLMNNPSHADGWIDVAGFAACGAEVTDAS